QAEELSRIEHLAVVAIAPSVQAISFVTWWNGIIRDESMLYLAPHIFDRAICCEIALLRFLKESTLMVGATHRTVIFDGEQAMPGWSRRQRGIHIHDAARRTDTTIMFGRPLASKLRLA